MAIGNYTTIGYNNGAPPPINATNLNKMDSKIDELDKGLDITNQNVENLEAFNDWNNHRTYKLFEPTFYNGVPYRSKQNNNINQNPETALDWWEVTGGGGVTINGTSNVTTPNNTVLALDGTGKFIVADKRYNTTCNALGFAKGPQTINLDGQILGNGSIVKGFSSLNPGKSVFLGDNGSILQDESILVPGDYRVHLGIALNATDLVVAIQEPLLMTVGGTNTKDGVGIEAFWPANLSAPGGWLKEDGAAISRTIYADLFSIIGTTYGIGDGSTTFNLPTVDGGIIRYIPWTTLGGVDQVTIDKVQKLEDFREWKAGETYALNEPVFYLGVPYRSLINGNFGNTPNISPAQWEVTGGGGGGVENYLINDLTKVKVGVTDVGVTSVWDATATNVLNTGALRVNVGASGTNRYIDLNIKNLDPNEIGMPWYVKFSYILGTNADDLVSVVLFDGTVEIPTAIGLLPYAGGTLQVTGGVVIPSNVLNNVKLRFKFKDNTAITFYVADVSVGPQNMLVGAAIGGWTSFNPSIIGGTLGTVADNRYRRVGNNMEWRFVAQITNSSDSLLFLLPSGFLMDIPLNVGSRETPVGYASYFNKSNGLCHNGLVFIINGNERDRVAIRQVNGTMGWWGESSPAAYSTHTWISFQMSVPISGWGSNINLITDFTEYVYNTSTTTTSDTTSFGYGPEGALLQAFAPTGTNDVTKRVRFNRPILPTDSLKLEVLMSNAPNTWVEASAVTYGFSSNDAGSIFYGCALIRVVNSNQEMDVRFYSASAPTVTWATALSSVVRWRVRKISNGNMAESISSIYESGSNSNGSYLKFSDGTMVQWGYRPQIAPTSGEAQYNLPAEFMPIGGISHHHYGQIVATVIPSGLSAVISSSYLNSSGFVIRTVSDLWHSSNMVSYIAFGRWRI